MPIGPLMLDLAGTCIDAQERSLLASPQVGGVILFTRNYQSVSQLDELVAEIRCLRPEIIIAVDQEGGRVQRFRSEFTQIPAMRSLGQRYLEDPEQGIAAAKQVAWLIAAELLVRDIDLSFAPVLDMDHGLSQVIGDRAFSDNPHVVIALAQSFIAGFHEAGMVATGKHFPGHGAVSGDSHTDIPLDERSFEEIESSDLAPFISVLHSLDAVMPAHVIYPAVDNQPAGFSVVWLQRILRERLGFQGVIFSDDLSMEGASVAGSYTQRAEAAVSAGCDMLLVCNNRRGAIEVLEYLDRSQVAASPRLTTLKHRAKVTTELTQNPDWEAAVELARSLA